ILPVFHSLFALASEDISFWYPPTHMFKSDENVTVHYRVRFFFSGWFGQGSRATYRYSLSSGRICAVMDYSVIDYLFAQSRSDFVSGCAGVCPPVSAIQECMGLAVLDLWRQAKEKNHRVKEVCKTISYKSCLPETHRKEIQKMTRLARYQIHKDLKHFLKKLGRCSAGEISLKLKYLMELRAVEPNYGSEIFTTSCSTVRVSGDGGIQTYSSDGQEWQTFCDFPQITEINIKRLCQDQLPAEGRVVSLTRQDDRCLVSGY
ncbi:tyrosine-protein kinase JAK2, partial [Tachysurus ichikawai]